MDQFPSNFPYYKDYQVNHAWNSPAIDDVSSCAQIGLKCIEYLLNWDYYVLGTLL